MKYRSVKLNAGILAVHLLVGGSTAAFAGQHADWTHYSKNLAPYVVAPEHAVDRMLSMAQLKPGETLYDLGCGDGRILIAAVKQYRVKAVGIEIAEGLARSAAEHVKKQGLQDEIR